MTHTPPPAPIMIRQSVVVSGALVYAWTGSVIVLVTSLLSICGHVVFSILLLQKWEELEDANGGAALNFVSLYPLATARHL